MHRSKTGEKPAKFIDSSFEMKEREIRGVSNPGDRTQRFNAKFLAQIDLDKVSMMTEVRRAEKRIKQTIGLRIAPSFTQRHPRQPQKNISNLVRKPLKKEKSFSLDTTSDGATCSILEDYRKNFKQRLKLQKIEISEKLKKQEHIPSSMRMIEVHKDRPEPLLFTAPFEYYNENNQPSHRNFEKKSTRLTETGNYESNEFIADRKDNLNETGENSLRDLNRKLDRGLHGRKDKAALFISSLNKICSTL